MSQTGGEYLRVLAAVSLDSSNEEEILLSLPHLVRGGQSGALLRLYHVLTPEHLRLSPMEGGSFLHELARAREAAEQKLSRYCALLRERLPQEISVDYWVESQEVASAGEEIALYLQKELFSLLVVAFKQRKRWERFFGTTALWDVLDSAPTPILLLPAPLSIPPKRVLWVSQMQVEEFPLLKSLIPIIRFLKATLYCAKINTPYSFYTHRSFQRHILAMCDYIIEQVAPDFVPEECILYADKDMAEGVLHATQDFLMDVVALSSEGDNVDWKLLDKLLAQQIPILLLRQQ
ncbi:MAG: hypothetical protein RMJ66_03180 [Bacteroidia bacterium]|nr:hypothetical protein [Bacteroidia bacterium]